MLLYRLVFYIHPPRSLLMLYWGICLYKNHAHFLVFSVLIKKYFSLIHTFLATILEKDEINEIDL